MNKKLKGFAKILSKIKQKFYLCNSKFIENILWKILLFQHENTGLQHLSQL